MRKILHVCSTLSKSGPITVLYNLLNNFPPKTFDISILTLSPPSIYSIDSKFEQIGVPVYTLHLSRLQSLLQGKKALRSFVTKHGVNLIHTHGFRADTLSTLCRKHCYQIATVHCIPQEDYRMSYGPIFGPLIADFHLQALRSIDSVVAVSSSVAKQLASSQVLSSVIHNGVDTKRFSPTKSGNEQITLRDLLKLPMVGNILISVGHLTPLKDPLTLIRGVAKAKFREPVALVLLGDGELKSDCATLAKKLGVQLFLPGQVNNVNEYLRAADFFISASHSEGLPLCVIEALACGLPVCLSSIPSHEEILQLNGKAGLTFPCDDQSSLALCLKKLFMENREELKSAALGIIKNHLSAKHMSIQYQQLYNQLLSEGRIT